MTNPHLDIDDLLAVAAGQAVPADRTAHLAGCRHCRQEAKALTVLEADLADPARWAAPSPAVAPDPARVESIRALAALLEAEDAAAHTWLAARPGRPTAEDLRHALTAQPEAATAGLVRALLGWADDLEQVAPAQSLGLATVAREVSGTLAPAHYPETTIRVLQGLAEKAVGTALRLVGRYPEALAAFDRAEAIFTPLIASHYDLACLAYSRATVFAAMDRTEAALQLTRYAAEELAGYGELRRVANARFLEAMLLSRRGEHDAALRLLLDLLDPVEEEGDEETLANLYVNLGNVSLARGDLSAAERFLRRGGQVLERIGRAVSVAKVAWRSGVLLAHAGALADGIAQVLTARQMFVELELPAEVAALTVEVIDLLLLTGDRAAARTLCQGLPEECHRLGLAHNGVMALAFLRDLGRADALTREAALEVRGFLAGLARDPDARFRSSVA
jgi:tetratricopeptide (TPR) repeat protein